MELKSLNSDQIITLSDFPVHSEHVLKIFFRIYNTGCGRIVPPCPVVRNELVISMFDDDLRKKFDIFVKENPRAKYFMLDGSHRTSAATLTGNEIAVMILTSQEDVNEAKNMAEAGELFHFYLKDTMKAIVAAVVAHFVKARFFQTVEQKTVRMTEAKVIPEYMIETYLK